MFEENDMSSTSCKSVFSKTIESENGNGSESESGSVSGNGQHIPKESMDKFTTSEFRQNTLNFKWK